MTTVFVSGHLDLTPDEFADHYEPRLGEALDGGADFVVGDARGADQMAQAWLAQHGANFRVFHMLERPRNAEEGVPLTGGFPTDEARDAAMTQASTQDIAWVRPGKRSNNGTAQNLTRRREQLLESDRAFRRTLPRFDCYDTEVYPSLAVRNAPEDPELRRHTIPVPQELVDRLHKARVEEAAAEAAIRMWIARQEHNPV